MVNQHDDPTIAAVGLQTRQQRVLVQVLIINLSAFTVMVMGTVFSQSSALLSGSLDNLGDALTYAISLAVISASSMVKARVAMFKSLLIFAAAGVVASQILWRLSDPGMPIVSSMSIAAALNLGANGLCLWLLRPFRDQDVNMSSVWECSRNDVFESVSVIVTAGLVWLCQSGWPDLLIAILLLGLFLRSAIRVMRDAWRELKPLQPA